jgi:hypothetical protein
MSVREPQKQAWITCLDSSIQCRNTLASVYSKFSAIRKIFILNKQNNSHRVPDKNKLNKKKALCDKCIKVRLKWTQAASDQLQLIFRENWRVAWQSRRRHAFDARCCTQSSGRVPSNFMPTETTSIARKQLFGLSLWLSTVLQVF